MMGAEDMSVKGSLCYAFPVSNEPNVKLSSPIARSFIALEAVISGVHRGKAPMSASHQTGRFE